MKAVIQRVCSASVSIGGEVRSQIGRGLMILLGVAVGDTEEDVDYLVKKTAALRIFDDEAGVMNLSAAQCGLEALVVSQFTLLASTRKGNRPSYIEAAGHETAVPLYESFCGKLSAALGRPVGTGVFGADMQVALINDGPVTICIDSRSR
ncbi:MAG: D-tyrosyl-tRNA(Tyr) deacylase [Bacteroidales bacterium]|nr:D-tyrosyl-tRNA(Tyr) deacylase [Bacteroidales bacterium]